MSYKPYVCLETGWGCRVNIGSYLLGAVADSHCELLVTCSALTSFNAKRFLSLLCTWCSQVELNRAILKNVGKRVFLEPAPWGSMRHKLLQQQQQQQQVQLEREREREQLRREQLQQQHFPSQLWGYSGNPAGSSDPSTASAASRFFDFLHRPAKEQQQQLLLDKSLKEGVAKHHQSNGNEIANDTNHENGHRKSATDLMSTEDELDNSGEDRDEMLYEPNMNWASEQHMDDMDRSLEAANGNSRMPWRLIYRMHKASHYAN